MRASWYRMGRTWTMRLALDRDDTVEGRGQGSMRVGLLTDEVSVELPVEVTDVHPDLVALATLTITRPWISNRLTLDRGVSATFAAESRRVFGVATGPIDTSLAPRAPGTTIGLAYSSGYDSAAASELLPPDTPHFHHARVPHPRVEERAPQWPSAMLRELVTESASHGKTPYVVNCNFEHMCHPYPTLPHWFGFAVGPLLLADHFDLGAIALGGTLETHYMDMGRTWKGSTGKPSGIDPLAAAVGLPVARPVLGLTEVGTQRIVAASPLAHLARSCTSTSERTPCGVCGKCVRKSLLASAISGSVSPSVATLDAQNPFIKKILAESPIYMHAQFEYALSRIPATTPLIGALQTHLAPRGEGSTSWLDRFYAPGIAEGVPLPWREYVETQIRARLEPMTEHDVESARTYSPA
ncbi:DUF6395 domain-containing protein [Cellulosimicrobium cellulans]